MRLAPLAALVALGCTSGATYAQSTDLFDAPIEWENHHPTVKDDSSLLSAGPVPFSSIVFADPDERTVGRISWSDGTLRFDGDVDASARAFFEYWYKTYAGPCHPLQIEDGK